VDIRKEEEVMSEEIAGFQVRYIERGGHHMVIEQGIKREQLHELQIQMLATSKIPGLLPLRIDEIDLQIQLLYNISSYKMLHYALQIRKLTDTDAIAFIKSLTDILGNSLNYLLHESKYVIHERMIYIGEQWGDVSLTYVPGNFVTLPSLQKQLKKLLSTLVQHMHNHQVSCDAIVDLQRYCEREAWTFSGFQQEVDNIGASPIWVQQKKEMSIEKQASLPNNSEQQPLIVSNQIPQAHSEFPKEEDNWKGTWWEEVEEISPKSSILKIELSPKAAKSIVYILLAILIVVGLQTAMSPTDLWIYSSGGILLIFASAILLLKNHLRPKDNTEDEEYVTPPARPTNMILQNDALAQTENVDLDAYYQQLGNKTTLLAPSHAMATTLLDAKSREQFDQGIHRTNQSKSQAFLETNTNGRTQLIRIHQTPFLIGRDEAGVNLTIQTNGASRIHAEISEGMGGYVIRDLDSKNGTFLNDRELVPYESYQLTDGDVVGIVACQIVFRK
jgi:Domain of unknown function (DUF6382)/FHA domain